MKIEQYIYANQRYYALLQRKRGLEKDAVKQTAQYGNVLPCTEFSIMRVLRMITDIEAEIQHAENNFANNLPNEMVMNMLYNNGSINI